MNYVLSQQTKDRLMEVIGRRAGQHGGYGRGAMPRPLVFVKITDVAEASGHYPCVVTTYDSAQATATQTSAKAAGAGASAGPGDVAWSSPGNITASDNTYTTSALTAGLTTEYLKATSFGFAVPADADIVGVTVAIERSYTGATAPTTSSGLQLLLAGTASGSDKTDGAAWPSSDGTLTLGGSSDTWGLTLTPADVNDTNFGVRVKAQNAGTGTARVDYISITVHYTRPGDWVDEAEECAAIEYRGDTLTVDEIYPAVAFGTEDDADGGRTLFGVMDPPASGASLTSGTVTSYTGTTFTLSAGANVWEATGYKVTLTGAGTYLVYCRTWTELVSSSGGVEIRGRLYNNTAAAAVDPDAIILARHHSSSSIADRRTMDLCYLVTISTTTELELQAARTSTSTTTAQTGPAIASIQMFRWVKVG